MNKTLFLDRDGVINIDFGYVHKKDNFIFNEYIFELCKKARELGYKIVIITNQAGIAKKYYSEVAYLELTNFMLKKFEEKDIFIEKVYYCPHKEEDNCNCRKPKSKLFRIAIDELHIDTKNSIMIGDKVTDLIPAHDVGIINLYLLKSKYKRNEVNFSYKFVENLKEIISDF